MPVKWTWTIVVLPLFACGLPDRSLGMAGETGGGDTGASTDEGIMPSGCTRETSCDAGEACVDGECVPVDVDIGFCPNTPTLDPVQLPEGLDGDVDRFLVADLDHDGRDDFVLSRAPFTKGIQVVFGPGDTSVLNVDVPAPVQALLDVDDDGELDLVAAPDEGITVYPGKGDGTFGDPVLSDTIGHRARFGDIDGDGTVDVTTEDTPWVWVAYGDGAGKFASGEGWQGFEELVVPVVVDVVGDSRAEVVYLDQATRLVAREVASEKETQLGVAGGGESYWIGALEAAGDERLDLVAHHYDTGAHRALLTSWIRTDDGIEGPRHAEIAWETWMMAAGEIDAEPGTDLLLGGVETLYLVFDAFGPDPCIVEYDQPEWPLGSLLDFDGDGRDEIIWTDQDEVQMAKLP
jgi:hypothetical protein